MRPGDFAQASGFYVVDYHCSNCGRNQSVRVPKGERKPTYSTCSNCGCHTLTPTFGSPFREPRLCAPKNPWSPRSEATFEREGLRGNFPQSHAR